MCDKCKLCERTIEITEDSGLCEECKARVESSFIEDGDARIAAIRKIVESKSFNIIDGVLVDTFTAQYIIQVYDLLSPINQKKLRDMGATVMANIVWKLVDKTQKYKTGDDQ